MVVGFSTGSLALGNVRLGLQMVEGPLNYESMLAFRRVSRLLPRNVPIILETPVVASGIERELEKVGWLIS